MRGGNDVVEGRGQEESEGESQAEGPNHGGHQPVGRQELGELEVYTLDATRCT